VGSVSPEQAPERVSKGLARHSIPLMVLARLAVNCEEEARSFYAHFGFVESPTDPLHLFVLLKDLRSHG
jgi:hypothetical protein